MFSSFSCLPYNKTEKTKESHCPNVNGFLGLNGYNLIGSASIDTFTVFSVVSLSTIGAAN